MRVMLIFPPNVDVVEPFKSARRKPPSVQWGFPMGLGYLAAVLKQAGFTVSVLDSCLDTLPIDDILDKVTEFQPDIVGIGSLTHTLRSAAELAKRIRRYKKNVRIVFGGPHVTFDYEALLRLDSVDYVVLGEGECTVLELCEKIKRDEPVREIKGIAFRDSDGLVKKTASRPLIKDLDSLPFPARELVDFRRYIKSYGVLENSVDVMSSRGCTNRCVFCSSASLFGRWRARSPESIALEIRTLTEEYPEIESINFMDDDFTGDKQRVTELCDLLIKGGLNRYSWVCLARVDQLDEEMIWAMKAAGCRRIHLGIESGSPRILKNINKQISLDQARTAVRLLSMARIEPYSFFMVGHPGETGETIELTRKFAKQLRSANTGFFVAQTFPGTRLEKLQPIDNWLDYIYEPEIARPSIFAHPCVPNFLPEGFDRETLKKICADMTKEFMWVHFLRRYRLALRKLVTEPKLTISYILKVFLNR